MDRKQLRRNGQCSTKMKKKSAEVEKHAIGSEAAAKKRTMFHRNKEKSAEVEKYAIGSEAARKERTMFHENEKK